LGKLDESKVELSEKLNATQSLLKELKYDSALESYAREEKLFKLDDEDIFVISYE
jgi:hypothetical protein